MYFVARRVARGLNDEFEFDELVSAGTLGLMNAMDNFEPERGLAFSTFAAPRIRGSILDEIRRLDFAPRSIRRKVRDIGAATESLSRELGERPTDAQTAARLAVDLETFWRWQSEIQAAVQLPLDGDRGPDDSGPPQSGFAAMDEPSPDDVLASDEETVLLRNALAGLRERERVVLSLYYFEDLNLQEIATVLSRTESRVSQIRSEALAHLRKALRALREVA